MPFTFSHPAIILPFLSIRSRFICISALIMGSIIPDFEYFIQMKLSGRFSHTLPGVLLFDLPVGLITLIIFHIVVKRHLIRNLPLYFSARLQPLKDFDFIKYFKNQPFAVVSCLLIGIASHIIWDGFTHYDGLFVPHIPLFSEIIRIQGLPDLPVYRYLQHISTGIGAIGIVYVFHKLPVNSSRQEIDLRFWTVLTFFFTVTFVIRISFGVEYYGDTIVVLISSGLIGLLVASALSNIKWSKT